MKVRITIGELVIEIDAEDSGSPNLTISGVTPKLKSDPLVNGHGSDTSEYPLTEKEKSVMRCVGEGLSNKEIARRIVATESTVKVHMKAILRKLRAKNRTEAAMMIRNGTAV